jgi:hypothetical protein
MVGTHGSSYEVHRVNWQQPQPAGAHRHYLTDKASQLAAAPIHTGKKFILWAWAHAFKRELAEKKSEITMKFNGRLSSTARTSQASLGAGDTASPGDTGDAGNGAAAAAAAGADMAGSHTVVTISGSSDGSGSGSGAAAPDVTPLQQQQQQQQLLASLDSLEAAEAENEYTINPRFTLVYKEVWVSDRGVDRDGFGQWVVDTVKNAACCDGSGGKTSAHLLDNSSSAHASEAVKQSAKEGGKGQISSSSSSSKDRSMRRSMKERLAQQDKLAELDKQLDAAAAAGAKFIIPGESCTVVNTYVSCRLQQDQQQQQQHS